MKLKNNRSASKLDFLLTVASHFSSYQKSRSNLPREVRRIHHNGNNKPKTPPSPRFSTPNSPNTRHNINAPIGELRAFLTASSLPTQAPIFKLLRLPSTSYFRSGLSSLARMSGANRPLSAASETCLYRFRTYRPPPDNFAATWRQRASVLILLFGDRNGNLQVALTTRSMKLRTHAGDVALPGGRAEKDEDVWTTARREAWEEIGLPENVPPPYTVEHLCRLRPHLSRHHLLVTPVVAYLSSTSPETHDPNKLVPSLDTEVSSLFSIPFEQFLRSRGVEGGVQDWRHESRQIRWLGANWIFHDFFATVTALVKPEAVDVGEDSSPVPTEILTRIWGLTARILVDACIVGYGRLPDFKHTMDVWDENKIEAMIKYDPAMGSIIGHRPEGAVVRQYSKL